VLTLEFFAMEFFVSSSSPFHTSFEFSGVFSFESFTMNSSEMTTEPFEHVSSAFSEFLVLTLEFLAMEFFVSSLSPSSASSVSSHLVVSLESSASECTEMTTEPSKHSSSASSSLGESMIFFAMEFFVGSLSIFSASFESSHFSGFFVFFAMESSSSMSVSPMSEVTTEPFSHASSASSSSEGMFFVFFAMESSVGSLFQFHAFFIFSHFMVFLEVSASNSSEMTTEPSSHVSSTFSESSVVLFISILFAMEFFVSFSSPFHASSIFSHVTSSSESFAMNFSEMTTEPFEHSLSASSIFLFVGPFEFSAMEFTVSSSSVSSASSVSSPFVVSFESETSKGTEMTTEPTEHASSASSSLGVFLVFFAMEFFVGFSSVSSTSSVSHEFTSSSVSSASKSSS
jgi:hypothetical protein